MNGEMVEASHFSLRGLMPLFNLMMADMGFCQENITVIRSVFPDEIESKTWYMRGFASLLSRANCRWLARRV